MLDTVLRSREFSIAIVLVLIILLARPSSARRSCFSDDGWRDTLLTPSILLLLAIGQAVVIITRNVDLSVGSIVGITAYVTGKIFIANPETNVVLVFLAGLLVGAALGAINGFLVAFFRVPALVVTLGTMYIYRGVLTYQIGNERIVAGDIPANFEKLGTEQILIDPAADDHRSGRAGDRRLLPAHRTRRPGALRHRLRPRRRQALRTQRRQARVRRVRAVRGAGRPRRGLLASPATPRRSPAPAATSSCRRWPRW